MSQKQNIKENTVRPRLSITDGAKAYAKLRKEVEAAGILERSYGYYVFTFLFIFSGFFLSYFAFTIATKPIYWLLLAPLCAFFTVQISGIFHDSGHRAIFNSAKNNDLVGYISCGLLAYTYKKWKITHNKHHANPNEEEMDPDIDRPIFAFSQKQMRAKNGFSRLLAKIQVFLYFPLGTLTAIYSQIAAFFYFTSKGKNTKPWEFIVYLIGLSCWLIAPFFLLNFWQLIIFYFAIYPMMGLYWFNVFAPNHKGMPQIRKGLKISFLEQQIITSRDVTGGFLTDIVLMGLNYQIEHHLFTNCPRNKLKLIKPYLLKLCKAYDLAYCETSLLKSNQIIFGDLKKISLAG